jgi:bifunctional UDP-N-acetylglucosamine pyrophosphorylase / glucosamine-1-phosphate N-acetyltransferase
MSAARAVVILAAGQGTRMRSALPKVLHHVGGRAMIDWSLAAAESFGADRRVVVIGRHGPEVRAHLEASAHPPELAVQAEPLGTAHAVRAAERALHGYQGDVAVLYGDTPLIQPQTLARMASLRAAEGGLAVLGFEAQDPTGYGRLILDEAGRVARIVEEREATPEERAVTLCNSGVFLADAQVLFSLLAMVKNENAKGEFYLTDIVGLGRSAGFFTRHVACPESEVLGVNSRVELAVAESVFQGRARQEAMKAGVTLIDPETVYFSHDTRIDPDVVVEPNVFFGPGVRIASGAVVRAFSHVEGASLGPSVHAGPFARLRPGADLRTGVKIGNFVEVKNAVMHDKAQASHLAYIGDADVGARANLGAGTITCNYDGFNKHRTVIGEGAFIGSDTALVAPVTIGAGVITGAGSVITKDVEADALVVSRSPQKTIPGWAKAFRQRKAAEKAARTDKANAKKGEQ